MKLLVFLSIILISTLSSVNDSLSTNGGNKSVDIYKTWISTQGVDGSLAITGNFTNNSNKSITISYLLITNKSGLSGNSSSTQKGKVEVKSYGSKILSSVSINVVKSDSYIIKLFTYNGNKIIGRDSVLYNMK